MSEMTEQLPIVANLHETSKGQFDRFFESQIQKPSVKALVRTSVSSLAIILPQFFMSEKDPSKMVKMLEELRAENCDIGKFDENKSVFRQNFVPANDTILKVKAA